MSVPVISMLIVGGLLLGVLMLGAPLWAISGYLDRIARAVEAQNIHYLPPVPPPDYGDAGPQPRTADPYP